MVCLVVSSLGVEGSVGSTGVGCLRNFEDMAKAKSSGWLLRVVFLIVLGGAGWGVWKWRGGAGAGEPVTFRTNSVARGDIIQLVKANGAIVPVKNVTVGSQVSGIIKGLNADFNSRVKEGDLIAEIDPSTFEQNVGQAEAELANSRAGLELAQVNFKRAKDLRDANLIPVSEYDKALADMHQSEAGFKIREAALKKANVDLGRTKIFAPISGLVIIRAVEVGQTVAASMNAPTLFQIAQDLTKMRIEASVSEADVGGVEEGQSVTFLVDAFQGRTFKGKVQQVRFAPTTNQNVVTYTTIVEVNNPDLKLRPGMTADASIITSEKTGVLKIPNAALRYRPPETSQVKDTNAPAPATGGTNQMAGSRRSNGGEGGGPDREEMRKRFESMTPEQREAMRARFGGGGGGGGGGGRPGGRSQEAPAEGPVTRTVYIVADPSAPAGRQLAKAVTIKTGITDGSSTEVLEGLNEGDTVITGAVPPAGSVAATTAARGTTSPMGGPFGGGGMRPR